MLLLGKFYPAKEWDLNKIMLHRSEVPKLWAGYYVAKNTKFCIKVYWYKNITKYAKKNCLLIMENK